MDFQQARANMIEQQIRPWDVLDQRILDVLSAVPREQFLETQYHGLAYGNFSAPIGHGQHMLPPTLDGRLLQSLSIKPTDIVLEAGTGSGYLTTCLAQLCHSVDSVEIVPELANSARKRLAERGTCNATVMVQDASAEWPVQKRYNAIILSGAVSAIPDFYRHWLHLNGRLVAVIGDRDTPAMEAVLVTRVREQEWSTESLFETRIEPLQGFTSESPSFTF